MHLPVFSAHYASAHISDLTCLSLLYSEYSRRDSNPRLLDHKTNLYVMKMASVCYPVELIREPVSSQWEP